MDWVIVFITVFLLWIVPLLFTAVMIMNRKLQDKDKLLTGVLYVINGWAAVFYLETIPAETVETTETAAQRKSET